MTQFGSLAPELRQSIWQFVCQQPRTLVVEFNDITPENSILLPRGQVYEAPTSERMAKYRFLSVSSPALFVNLESRQIALESYQFFFKGSVSSDQSNAYFNPKLDTCYVRLASGSYGTDDLGFATALLCGGNSVNGSPMIRFLALDFRHFEHRHFAKDSSENYAEEAEDGDRWGSFFKYTPSLERLTFIRHGDDISCSTEFSSTRWIPMAAVGHTCEFYDDESFPHLTPRPGPEVQSLVQTRIAQYFPLLDLGGRPQPPVVTMCEVSETVPVK